MRVTVDTNVLFAALYSNHGASAFIFDLFSRGQLRFALSVPTYMEYQDVLLRPSSIAKVNISVDEMRSVLRFVAHEADVFDINFLWRPNLRDEADNMFVELAVRSQSHFLITHNLRDFTMNPQLQFDDVSVITPRQFIPIWRQSHE